MSSTARRFERIAQVLRDFAAFEREHCGKKTIIPL